MVGEQHYLTAEGRKDLEEELHRLKTIERPDIAQRIHKAHETGGNVDNAEYEEVKEEQSFIEGRIQDIERTLSNSITAPSHDPKGGLVDFGSTVTVKPAKGGAQTYVLVGSAEAKPLEGRISNESPVGKALMGHKAGDTVEVQTPAGVNRMKITKVK